MGSQRGSAGSLARWLQAQTGLRAVRGKGEAGPRLAPQRLLPVSLSSRKSRVGRVNRLPLLFYRPYPDCVSFNLPLTCIMDSSNGDQGDIPQIELLIKVNLTTTC